MTQWIQHLKKALLFFIIFSLLPVFAYQYPPSSVRIDSNYSIRYASLLASVAYSITPSDTLNAYPVAPLSSLDIITVNFLLLGIVISYALATAFLLVLRSLTPKQKASIYEILRITKGKLILSALGWLTVGSLVFAFLLNFTSRPPEGYIGVINVPSGVSMGYQIFMLFAFALYPFTAYTFQILFPATSRAITWFLGVQGFPPAFLYVENWRYHNPAYLSVAGACIFTLMMLLEWFLASCLVVSIYSKARRWQTSRKSRLGRDKTNLAHLDDTAKS